MYFPNDIFLKFHHLQVNLIKSTSKESINDYYKNLINLLESIPEFNEETPESCKLIEFLLLPILNVLKKFQLNSDMNEILLKSCRLVLEKIKNFNSILFYDLLNITSILLSKNKIDSNKTKQSEEFLINCFQLIQSLFKRSSFKILDEFYTFKNLTLIGLLISLCLDTLNETTSQEVRLESLNTLKELTQITNKNNYEKISIILCSFLPGISIKLIQKFLLAQNLKLLNHKLICSSLELFSHVVFLVFNDSLLNENFYKSNFDSCFSPNLNNEIKGLMVNRLENKDWINVSSEKIFILIENLLDALITTDNFHIKLSLVNLCGTLSDKCYFTLNKYLPKILKILVTYAAGDDEKLTQETLKFINVLESKEILKNDCKFLAHSKFSILESCFEEILIKLPRIMQSKIDKKCEINDEYRLSHLKTLYGYLKLVGDYQKIPKLHGFFSLNSNNLSHLIEGLLSCVQFDFKSLNNFYEIDNRDDLMRKSQSLSNYTGLKTYLDDQVLYEQLSLICNYLGRSDSVRLIIDELLNRDFINSDKGYLKLEVMFIINLLLNGLKEQNLPIDDLISIVNLIFTIFLNDFNNLSENFLEEVESIPLSMTNKKNQIILQTCLILESIRLSSKLFSSDNFNIFLIDTLYFILENYLNTNLLIQVVSTQCLVELASNLGYKNIQDLLSINFDYIMNDLILKSNNQNRLLKSCSVNSNELADEDLNKQSSHVFVLCALLEISNSDIIPYLTRIIDEFFFSIQINPNEIRLILGVCRIMTYMAKSMRKWFPLKFNFIDEIDRKDEFLNLNLQKLAQARKKSDYTKSMIDVINEINDSIKSNIWESNKNENIEENSSEENKNIPLHVELQKRCLELCTHLISHPFRQVRIQIIDLARELSKNLAEYTNEFLPLVHKLWSPICYRFSSDDLIVKSKIIQLLFDLSVLCSDFISSRFTREFLPRLNSFMREQAKVSGRSSKIEGGNLGDATYIYSHAFKLQCKILSNLDKMCVLFEIKEIELENLIDSCILVYLDKLQPKKLQLLALNACKSCALIDPDVVWLSLHYVLPFQNILSNKFYLDNEKDLLNNLNYSSDIKLKYNFNLNEEIILSLLGLFSEI
ncbi:unnamed protein product [Brachionus calyciflorus]|uniref:Uncharacterized protein n=1 Tax=Brachionus calyciflorus TaxID=104777 RepID=A0A813W1X1_9BILA|nr:unnamed protein product [Brachionus calyciflorus]